MSDTPRTDANSFHLSTGVGVTTLEFARELERENARLRHGLERIARTTMSHVINDGHGFQRCRELAAETLGQSPAPTRS